METKNILEDLKEAMAKEEGFDTWADLEYKTNFTSMKILWERLANRYADQRLNEYKEKLKTDIIATMKPEIVRNERIHREPDFLFACEEILKLL